MAYACGDCYPQFRIDSILSPNKSGKNLLGEDVYLVYKKNGQEISLGNMVDSSMQIARDGENLIAKLTGRPQQLLVSASETQFFDRFGSSLTFQSENEKITYSPGVPRTDRK